MTKTYTEEQTREWLAQLARHEERVAVQEKSRSRKAQRRLVRRSRRANRGNR